MCFILGNKVSDYTEFSYMLTKETFVSLNWLMRDLRETSLTSVRVYEDDLNKESPVLTFEGASKVGSGKMEFSNYGTPLWQKYLIYTLVPDVQVSNMYGIKVASLVRYELSSESALSPLPAALELAGPKDHPNLPAHLQSRRVIIRNIVLEEQDLDFNGSKDKEYKGFDVKFVRRDKDGKDVLTNQNPALAEDIEYNTKLLNVELTVLQVSGATGKQNILGFSFRVHPRN
jgi:hypothetical protein